MLSVFQKSKRHFTIVQGVIGECGRRGGYLEITNIPLEVKEQLYVFHSFHCHPLLNAAAILKPFAVSYKLVSIGLCSNLNGQIMTDLMVAPPKPGDASYPLYQQEVTGIFSSLKRRASKVSAAIVHSLLKVEFAVFLLVRSRLLYLLQLAAALNSMKNVSCTSLDGAMYDNSFVILLQI